jgi:hypothetical protein
MIRGELIHIQFVRMTSNLHMRIMLKEISSHIAGINAAIGFLVSYRITIFLFIIIFSNDLIGL